MKSIMCLNEKSITNIPIAIMTEAIITMVALLWSSDHDGPGDFIDQLVINVCEISFYFHFRSSIVNFKLPANLQFKI